TVRVPVITDKRDLRPKAPPVPAATKPQAQPPVITSTIGVEPADFGAETTAPDTTATTPPPADPATDAQPENATMELFSEGDGDARPPADDPAAPAEDQTQADAPQDAPAPETAPPPPPASEPDPAPPAPAPWVVTVSSAGTNVLTATVSGTDLVVTVNGVT